MALIKCSECGKQISDKSTTCVHCGNPIKKEKIKSKKKKTWEELSREEVSRVISYRKLKKEYWVDNPSPALGVIFGIIGFILIIVAMLILKKKAQIICVFAGALPCFIIEFICVILTQKEHKKWYEKNVDRLYEEEIIK